MRGQQRRRRLKGDQVRAQGGFHPIQTSTATTNSSPARIGGTGLARLISLMTRLQNAHRYFLNRATVRWTKVPKPRTNGTKIVVGCSDHGEIRYRKIGKDSIGRSMALR